ncbi:type II toxin-antitoxin system RelE/ParE family toxin [Psychrobacter phenylpyruvicus]|uniref:Phage-related protein n=1 Tax=Psychrobacter phenylpyruvicus TaxID=29432 RepID=A0A379LM91_9GAMM|nr:type II toxin-antitoxin system RelE/ParE family toxin [Psychrobacter phenylpyruvicus]SUD90894.1 Phage-related protein [Psychrobacter phenylpyruvicus]
MKDIEFLGTSLDEVRSFPENIKQDTGYQLHKVQIGDMPDDFKPMRSIGSGVIEIRLKDANGIYRVIYTAKFADVIYVLHAFTKKTQKTPQSDIMLAKTRLKELIKELQDD